MHIIYGNNVTCIIFRLSQTIYILSQMICILSQTEPNRDIKPTGPKKPLIVEPHAIIYRNA